MARVKESSSSGSGKKTRPALSVEARENQLIARAVDLAEQQLMAGTASSQVITHFLKLGSTKAKLENELKMKELELMAAKTKQINNAEESKVLYEQALKAMRNYAGQGDPDEY